LQKSVPPKVKHSGWIEGYVQVEQILHILLVGKTSVIGHFGSANRGHLANQTRKSSNSVCPTTRLMLAQGWRAKLAGGITVSC